MPALILSESNLATKQAVHIHYHKVQNTEVIYITLNYTSCSQALTKSKKKLWTHNIAESVTNGHVFCARCLTKSLSTGLDSNP